MAEFIAPLQPLDLYRVSQPFKPGQHLGIDFALAEGGLPLPIGTPVLAVADGTVSRVADEPGGAGLHTNVDHADGVQTRDFHLSGFAVSVGQDVKQGDVLGFSGNTGASTGPHLHHEHHVGGPAVDPAPYMNPWTPPAPPIPVPPKEITNMDQFPQASLDGHLIVAIRGDDGNCYTAHRDAKGDWDDPGGGSKFFPTGDAITSWPTVSSDGKRVTVSVLGHDRNFYAKEWTPAKGWGETEKIGGPVPNVIELTG